MVSTLPYNELEYLILALMGEGVSSGYAIRKTMNRMRGGRWSTESGSVYRVIRRLEKDDLIHEVRKAGVPNRERTEYELTGQGRAVLTSWLTLPLDRQEVAFLVDPVRTRSYFLSRLSATERAMVVSNWLRANQEFCDELAGEIDSVPWTQPLQQAAYQNLLELAKARHKWLKSLEQIVDEETVTSIS